jgi:hypothetical protein
LQLFGETAALHTYADAGPAVNGPTSKWTNEQLRTWKSGHFGLPEGKARVCSSAAFFARSGLGYGGDPVHHPEVHMSSLKTRMYPVMIAAITVIAATGGYWRIG